MTSRLPTKPSGWFSGRTRLVTIVSIVAVSLAGATAVSANIGILNSASDSPVGDASVTGDLSGAATEVVDVYLADTSTSTVSTSTLPGGATVAQQYIVDVAGKVFLASAETGLRLDHVEPATGWTWTLAQDDPNALQVTMTNGIRTFEFQATRGPDGTIAASVNEPVVTRSPAPVLRTGPAVTSAPATAPTSTLGGVSHDHDDEYEDHDDEHEDEHDEYEGGDDDD